MGDEPEQSPPPYALHHFDQQVIDSCASPALQNQAPVSTSCDLPCERLPDEVMSPNGSPDRIRALRTLNKTFAAVQHAKRRLRARVRLQRAINSPNNGVVCPIPDVSHLRLSYALQNVVVVKRAYRGLMRAESSIVLQTREAKACLAM